MKLHSSETFAPLSIVYYYGKEPSVTDDVLLTTLAHPSNEVSHASWKMLQRVKKSESNEPGDKPVQFHLHGVTFLKHPSDMTQEELRPLWSIASVGDATIRAVGEIIDFIPTIEPVDPNDNA
ncbi:MAG: hypothetical protein JWN38_1048 [Candidatus Saccharibacteria bacterium]|nr:hypothetical protein [Candidatus Saccharibacteria bacterium]